MSTEGMPSFFRASRHRRRHHDRRSSSRPRCDAARRTSRSRPGRRCKEAQSLETGTRARPCKLPGGDFADLFYVCAIAEIGRHCRETPARQD